MSLRNILLAATIIALPGAATAQPLGGLYIGAGAGVNFMQGEHLVGPTPRTTPPTSSTRGSR
jgi:hypothetical protein